MSEVLCTTVIFYPGIVTHLDEVLDNFSISPYLQALLSTLTARTDGLGIVLDVSAGRVHVEELGSVSGIITGKEQSDTEGSRQG